MGHLACARRTGVGIVMVFGLGGFVFAGLASGQSATASPTTTTVEIKYAQCGFGVVFCFDPSTAQVSVGDTVRWTDRSSFTHSVTRCDPQDCEGHDGGTGQDTWVNGTVSSVPVQDFSHTFSSPGTYVYYCSIHGYETMNGTITVADAAQVTSSTTTTTTTTTTSATPTTAATTRSTTAAPSTTATPSSVAALETTTASASQLARTGSSLRVIFVGLLVLGLGVVLVSAGHRMRRYEGR
jgi:plastocyanin